MQGADPRPLGQIAAQQFDLNPQAVCAALAEQIVNRCPRTNLANESFDANCRQLVSAPEAWSSLVLPMRVAEGVLVCATTAETLDRAIGLMQQRTACPYRFVIAPIRQLEQYICQLYDYEGLDIGDVA